jgi:hypothetical protein
MKHLKAPALILLALLAAPLAHAEPEVHPDYTVGRSIGTPVALGVIVATTSKNNTDTATPFNATAGEGMEGKVLLFQSDTACFCKFGADSTVAATTSTTGSSFELAAKERVVVAVAQNLGFLACIASSGTSNVKVWELR